MSTCSIDIQWYSVQVSSPLHCPYDFPYREVHPAQRPQHKKGVEPLEHVQRRAKKLSGHLKHLSYNDSLWEMFSFSLEKRMPWGDLTGTSQCLEGTYKKDRPKFYMDNYESTKGNNFKLKYQKFKGLDTIVGFRPLNAVHELLAEAFEMYFNIVKRRANPQSVSVLIHLRSRF